MAGDSFDYEDVTVYTLESEDEERLLKLQNECTFLSLIHISEPTRPY